MTKPFYAVKVQSSVGGSYTRPDIFQNKDEAIEFSNKLKSYRRPQDRFMVHLYEVKELEF